MTSGHIGAFLWIEGVPREENGGLIDTVRKLRHHLIELRAVNASWDSGLLAPSDPEWPQGWTIEQGRAVSPVIDDRVIDAWPSCDDGWEEWYFFSTLPKNLHLSAYCNWCGTSIGDWPSLVNVPTGLDLKEQLETAQPAVVIGEGRKLFAISRNIKLLEDFRTFLEA